MTVSSEITLEQLLKAREQRAEKQKELIKKYALPLVSFTVNMPGACKKTPVSSSIFQEGCDALMKKLNEKGSPLVHYQFFEPDTGYEAYFVVNTGEQDLKDIMIQIENEHLLGRLFDLDVIGRDGIPVSREALGYSKRKCLLCEQDAHICARSRKHSVEALMQEIEHLVESYLRIS